METLQLYNFCKFRARGLGFGTVFTMMKQFIYQINMWQGINEDIAGCWAKRAIIASEPYTGHRHTLTNYVSIHKQLGKHTK